MANLDSILVLVPDQYIAESRLHRSTVLKKNIKTISLFVPGPTLEGLKKPPLLSHKLNTTEIGAVRQLITGYRESAAFLLRSADELEHLLQIQPKL